ncbi:MAG: DegV family protein [Coriobacteriales bacterium]|nr:DegV family protein [Coriobacteriales bacterium]
MIALIVDSCTDITAEDVPDVALYTLPLLVVYGGKEHCGEYRDKLDISSEQVCERLHTEIPTTSLPSLSSIHETFARVVADGFTEAIVVTISSALSGTYNAIKLVSEQYSNLKTCLIDTRSIGFGAGFVAVEAARLIRKQTPFAMFKNLLEKTVRDAKVFFCVESLDYLHKGGRIGEVIYRVGSILNIKPIISCNEKGAYYIAHKARGIKAAHKKTLDAARSFAMRFNSCHVAVVHGAIKDDAKRILIDIREHIPNVREIYSGIVSPALIVHTGPDILGIGVQGF